MAFDSLTTGRATATLEISAGKNTTGGPQITNTPLSFTKRVSFSFGSGALAFNNAYCAVTSIPGGGNTTLDLSGALTSIVNEANMALTGAKVLGVFLLGTGDTAPDGTTVGTAASSITIGNATNPCLFGFGAAAHTWTVTNGDFFLATISTAAGWTVTNATADGLKIVNNDGAVTAKVLVVIAGIG
jgi:hypothetical protein